MPVETVLGSLGGDDLGFTSVHEHLIVNLACWFDPPADSQERQRCYEPISAANEAKVRENPFAFIDNLILDSLELAVDELGRFKQAGGTTIIDLTTPDIGRDPRRLRAISLATGVNVVMGSGRYIASVRSNGTGPTDPETVQGEIVRDLLVGVDGIRAGVIGEIGTSDPLDPSEIVVMQGACRAQLATRVPLFVHLDPWGRNGHTVLDLCEQQGVDPARVALCHLDPSLPDIGYASSLADRGANVCLDIFGDEDSYGGRGMPTDDMRLQAVMSAYENGWQKRLLVAQDVCTKTQLHAYGGHGYDHLLHSVLPRLMALGLDGRDIRSLLVENPRALLVGE